MSPSLPQRRGIAAWLLVCCALVFAMVVVGGMTRLTHSGLSIVQWQPLVGTLPPLGEAQWAEAFAQYQRTPEFRLRNPAMELSGFKAIFWWEYFHRLLGRAVGAAFLLPLLYFVARGRVGLALGARLGAIFVLGGLQGALGWYMVKSGLVDEPRVASERLAAHLGLAFIIYALMLRAALDLLVPDRRSALGGTRALAALVAVLVFAMVLSGALVAAIHAGSAYNTFPLMNGQWIPDEVLLIVPWWENFLHNMATVQLVHRGLALLILALVAATWWHVRRDARAEPRARVWSTALLGVAVAQVTLGISTLLLHVPLPLAALHQAGAVLVFTCALGLAHAVGGSRGLQA